MILIQVIDTATRAPLFIGTLAELKGEAEGSLEMRTGEDGIKRLTCKDVPELLAVLQEVAPRNVRDDIAGLKTLPTFVLEQELQGRPDREPELEPAPDASWVQMTDLRGRPVDASDTDDRPKPRWRFPGFRLTEPQAPTDAASGDA